MYNQSVTKDWVMELPFRMQSVLIAALRGYDHAPKDDPSKLVSRSIRSLVLHNADPTNTFITQDIPDEKITNQFLWDIDAYPLHFVCHTMHAIEIIGYKHPDQNVRSWYRDFYWKLAKAFHLNYETEEQLDVRLGTTKEEERIRQARNAEFVKTVNENFVEVVNKPRNRRRNVWDAGTGTSHGGRTRTYSGSS